MKNRNRTLSMTLAGALAGIVLLGASPAMAQTDSEVGACVEACMETAKACSDPVREAAVACREEAGCDALAETAKTACKADRASDDCATARTALAECAAPCREAQKSGLAECRDASLTCLRDDCGIESLPSRCRPGRGGHPKGN